MYYINILLLTFKILPADRRFNNNNNSCVFRRSHAQHLTSRIGNKLRRDPHHDPCGVSVACTELEPFRPKANRFIIIIIPYSLKICETVRQTPTGLYGSIDRFLKNAIFFLIIVTVRPIHRDPPILPRNNTIAMHKRARTAGALQSQKLTVNGFARKAVVFVKYKNGKIHAIFRDKILIFSDIMFSKKYFPIFFAGAFR